MFQERGGVSGELWSSPGRPTEGRRLAGGGLGLQVTHSITGGARRPCWQSGPPAPLTTGSFCCFSASV